MLRTVYSGTPLTQPPLGPTQSVLIKGASLLQVWPYFRGCFTHKHMFGTGAMSALEWMSIFQGCPQGGGVPLYWGNFHVGMHLDFHKTTVHRDFVRKSLSDCLVIYTQMYIRPDGETSWKKRFAKICKVCKNLLTRKFLATRHVMFTML